MSSYDKIGVNGIEVLVISILFHIVNRRLVSYSWHNERVHTLIPNSYVRSGSNVTFILLPVHSL